MHLIYSAEILPPSVTIMYLVLLVNDLYLFVGLLNMVGSLKTTSFCEKNYVSSYEKTIKISYKLNYLLVIA